MKQIYKFTLPVLAMLAAVACSKTAFEPADPNEGKELISFAGDGALTKAGLTKAGLTKAGFAAETKVVMRIKAEENASSPRAARFATAEAIATAELAADHGDAGHDVAGPHSDLNYISGEELFWDDAFGRASKLTVYAFAIPEKKNAALPVWSSEGWAKVDENTNPDWFTGTEYVTVSWDVLGAQSAETMAVKDLTYSNNISVSGKGGRYTHTYNAASSKWELNSVLGDGPMSWTKKPDSETTGKFDQGHLVFNHALAKIEIRLKEGAGFDNTKTTDFGWTNPTTQSIKLNGFYTKGTFDVSTAAWSDQASVDITSLYEKPVTNASGVTTHTLECYVVPGNNLYNTLTNVIEFEIDNAQYYVTGKQIAEAIRSYDYGGTDGKKYASFTTLESGKHYVINLLVAKKGIERITAALVDWEQVNAETDARNTHPTFDFEDRGTAMTGSDGNQFNIYRAEKSASDYVSAQTVANYDWSETYEAASGKTWDSTDSEWSADSWYWKDNKTYYHFRAAGYTGNTEASVTIKDETSADYFEMGYDDYKDYIWGAPLADIDANDKIGYSTESGFDNASGTSHQILPAIAATDEQIKLVMFHMTSQIKVNVHTTTGASRVVLQDGINNTKVEIVNFLPDGTVLMGNGLVTATGDRTTREMTTGTFTVGDEAANPALAAKFDGFNHGVVPQSLSYTGGTVGLRITTPDGNEYYVTDLSTVTGSVTSENMAIPYTEVSTGKYAIDAWYPNFKYTYTVTVQKKGVERITASVIPWQEVISDDIPIDLEN